MVDILQIDKNEFRRLLDRVVERVAQFVVSLEVQHGPRGTDDQNVSAFDRFHSHN